VGARGAAAQYLRRLFDVRNNPRWRRWVPEVLAGLLYLGLAFIVTAGLWLSGGSAATADNTRDHAQFLFFFEHAAHAVVNLHNPFFTTMLGAPYGVNLMANTAFLGLAVPLIPVTLTLGPGISYALALTIGLAGTAAAWYVLLRRHVTSNRAVAVVIGAFCGFFPGIVGHGNGHPNISAQFMLPLIVSAVARLGSRPRPVRAGVLLGLMTAYQVFLNEELLLFTAAACVVMVVTYAASRPAEARARARPFLVGLAVALGVAGVLTAYPLWFQFFGPQHYRGPFGWAQFYGADLGIYAGYGSNPVAGRLGAASPLNDDPGETNAFIGLPLVIVAMVVAAVLWRVLVVRIAAIIAAVFALLSLGDTIVINGHVTGLAGPWRVLSYLPLLDSVITIRLALVVVPAIGVIVAAGLDRLLADVRGVPRALAWGLAAALLLPLVPTPLRVTQPEGLPAFITAGTWREYLDGGTLVPIPPDPYSEPTLRALVTTDLQTRFIDGYFLGPTSPENPIARYGPPDRPTGLLLTEVAVTGLAPDVDEELQATAREDIRFWEADALILAPQEHFELLRRTVSALIDREGEPRDGVWVWDVRDLR
jgi:hypothetical protein